MIETACSARRGPDGDMHCFACRLTWSVDDPAPPACHRELRTPPATGRLPIEPLVATQRPLEFASGLPFTDNQRFR